MSLHVVRHAKAGKRGAWDQPDELRPLSTAGEAQAEALCDLFASAPLERILTSRYRRCTQTVEPLAARFGLKVEYHQALAEEADIADTWALLEELSGSEAVLCTHGNLIGPVLDRLRRRGAEVVADQWVCKKGSVWTIEPGTDGAFVRARYTPPPA